MRTRILLAALAVSLGGCASSRPPSPSGEDHPEAHSAPPRTARSGRKEESKEERRPVVSADGDQALMQQLSGLRVVNGQPYADMFFRNYGVNPTIDTAEESTSTFSVDVDTGSYTLARSYLERGNLPDPDGIRVEEFVNAFDYNYQPPQEEPFSVSMEVAPSPNRQGYHVLQLGVKGREIDRGQRKPANLVFVVDTSGSMNIENRLGSVRHALSMLTQQMEERDSVGIVAYGTTAYVVLEPTSGADTQRILSALNGLTSSGSTNVQAGLELGYRMAAKRANPMLNSRIILCSDGVANNGVATDADGIFKTVKDQADKGITLTTVGFGMGNYNDVLMERLADQGDGFYAYVDRPAEAERIFVRALTSTLEVIAKDVKVQVQFNPDSVTRYRLIGYENRHVDNKDFANDKVDAGEIGAGHSVTAIYEVKLKDTPAHLGTLRIRYKAPEGGESRLREWSLPRSVVRSSLRESSAASRLAWVVAGFAEKLRQSYWARTLSYDDLLRLHSELPPALASRPDVVELRSLIETARTLDHRADRFEHVAPRAQMSFDTLPVLQ